MDWLLSSLDATRAHIIDGPVSWHGRGMVLAWGFLFPLGVLMARFFKIMPNQNWPTTLDNVVWWHTHRILQYSGLVIVALALGLILTRNEPYAGSEPHRWLGWLICSFLMIQFLSALLRGTKGGPTEVSADGSMAGDHYDITPRRVIFEWVHKSLGYVLVVLSIGSILSGLWLVNAPIWMYLGQAVWWAGLIGAFVILQRQGRAVDTYQAIWGPDPVHPGNRKKPIGWGIHRRK